MLSFVSLALIDRVDPRFIDILQADKGSIQRLFSRGTGR
jgi:hypothetical protein